MPTVSVRLFRCTGMEAAEMCHRREGRRGEEFCVWGDAQRKERVGCRDVYKEELTGALSPRLAQTRSLARSDFTAEVEEQIGKRAKQDLSNHLSSSRTLRTEYLTALTDY